MKTSDFDYALPPELIAQTPLKDRDHSRMLYLHKESGEVEDKHFYDIVDILGPNDVLVLNKTRVIKARLKGYISVKSHHLKIQWQHHGFSPFSKGSTWGNEGEGLWKMEVEIFLHKQLSEDTWDCLVYPGRKLKPGTSVTFEWQLKANIQSISEAWRVVQFNLSWSKFLDIIDSIWHTPLPPYIQEQLDDTERYQTVFNEVSGSVAAPTAGLHFTPEILSKLQRKWVQIETVLLHVGLGTFKGVEVEDIKDHLMHKEYIEIEPDTAMRLNTAKSLGKRIIAVGTTSVRTLESMSSNSSEIQAGSMETDIFIYPGYTWKCVDAIITNFHLPKSTLLMLVSSFATTEHIKKAYQHAVDQKYRFFSFWDAMLIE